MRGTWRAVDGGGDVIRYTADLGGGRVTDPQQLRLRRVDGEIVGLEIGVGESARFYVRAPE